jgi:hypothetical protein
MAENESETLTIRIPKGLKGRVEKEAKARSMTITGVVRQALQDALRPIARTYQHPGLSAAFDDFLKNVSAQPILVLVMDERSGQRYFFCGSVARSLTNESILAIKRKHDAPWIIPRRDIVAWFGGARGDLDELSLSLARQGWADRSRDA